MHTHLAKGANLLAGAEAGATIKTLGSDDEQAQSNEDQILTPPLDYAQSNGTLREDFGIEKIANTEERNESGYPTSAA